MQSPGGKNDDKVKSAASPFRDVINLRFAQKFVDIVQSSLFRSGISVTSYDAEQFIRDAIERVSAQMNDDAFTAELTTELRRAATTIVFDFKKDVQGGVWTFDFEKDLKWVHDRRDVSTIMANVDAMVGAGVKALQDLRGSLRSKIEADLPGEFISMEEMFEKADLPRKASVMYMMIADFALDAVSARLFVLKPRRTDVLIHSEPKPVFLNLVIASIVAAIIVLALVARMVLRPSLRIFAASGVAVLIASIGLSVIAFQSTGIQIKAKLVTTSAPGQKVVLGSAQTPGLLMKPGVHAVGMSDTGTFFDKCFDECRMHPTCEEISVDVRVDSPVCALKVGVADGLSGTSTQSAFELVDAISLGAERNHGMWGIGAGFAVLLIFSVGFGFALNRMNSGPGKRR